jgi:hypothetical protein
VAYASIDDVSTRLGRPISSTEEVAQVGAWLSDVEALILTRIPTLEALVLAGAPTPDLIVMVEANAVIRKILNPEGKVAENVDDYQYRFNENVARGDLFLTDAEWALLTPAAASNAFTIRPYGEPGYRTDSALDWS